jgi:hypothetical protein
MSANSCSGDFSQRKKQKIGMKRTEKKNQKYFAQVDSHRNQNKLIISIIKGFSLIDVQ